MRKNKARITVEQTGVVTYYAVNLAGITYTVTDMYDTNADYTERTILELETQQEPSAAIRNSIAQAIDDFAAES